MRNWLILLLTTSLLSVAAWAQPPFGSLQLGMGEKEVLSSLGAPAAKSEIVFEAATGEYYQSWTYDDLKLDLSSLEETGARSLYRIYLFGPSAPKTSDGLAIGLGQKAAQGKLKAMAKNGVVYSDNGGGASVMWEEAYILLSVTYQNGKVHEIYLGPGPE